MAALDARGADYRVRLYLDAPPSAEELDAVLRALEMEPWELARPRESAERGLTDAPRDRDAWIAAMVADPILIQRPILVAPDGRAALGRPPETVLDLLI